MCRFGDDATIVAWGNCVELAEKTADQLAAGEGVSIEIIDLQSIVPCDWEGRRLFSTPKTGRLVVRVPGGYAHVRLRPSRHRGDGRS